MFGLDEHVIPQEFNQEDKIGNFTIGQVAIIGAVLLIGILMLGFGVPIIWALSIFIPMFIGAVYAMFKKVNEVPIYQFFFVYLIHVNTPKLLIYRQENVKEEYREDSIVIDEKENEEKRIGLKKKRRRDKE